jgi:SNF2 family DNA or RNA helicase
MVTAKYCLKQYQREGVNFMVKVLADPQYRAVILQDEMGLEKTGI